MSADAKHSEKVIILESGKCSWGKCIFCNFGKNHAAKRGKLFNPMRNEMIEKKVPMLDLSVFKERIERAVNGTKIDTLKFFNSGSFLDEAQISAKMRRFLFSKCEETGIKELIVECRAEHVTEMKLNELKHELEELGKNTPKLTFAIGLEVADDAVLKKIQKGMTLAQYERAEKVIRKTGFGVRTYLMANLPFVGNVAESLDKSVNYSLKHSDSIAIINAFAYGYSPLFEMWLEGLWHPLNKKEFDALVKKYKNNKKINIYFDDYITYTKFPENLQKKLVGVGNEYIMHPYFNVWQEYLSRFYEIPEGKKYALFLPCSFRKPYSQSKTHREILRHLTKLRQYPLIHQIMISNPGVIPREFENKYPFAHYDWQEWLETPQIKKEYIEATQNRIKKYLAAHKYAAVFSYMKPTSESFIALKDACEKLKIKLISCVDEKIFTELKNTETGLIKSAEDDRETYENLLINRKMLDNLVEVLRKNLK
ncbi:MAG: DUF5591 domain-containing protein [Nanoarchaeota archaeon]|nr:DUF5591 domain-containing protein [Nanoarchaeota archaeon]MBU4300191.1 DUF5591 domain-containing protein [Nanoarchaeota archaeon]MBU4452065.1 DUF5591 domain-containing protein [Nanoarchaeota archaeon]MCG2724446.1 DUF5591 domain-containing protein [archaeon]